MPIRRTPRLALATLLVSHGLVLWAGFFAPYDSTVQSRELPYAPPTRMHFVDRRGRAHIRPFVYRLLANAEAPGGYSEETTVAYPIHFFAFGPAYELSGTRQSRIHLFGTDEPAKIFLMGSDAFGRDQFSRFLYGGRISLLAGLLATFISLCLGITLGSIAGLYGSWPDEFIMRLAEVFLALPWLYLLFAVRAFLPLTIAASKIFLLLIAVMGVIGWARPARLIRGVVLSAKERDYVLAARGFGASDLYLLRRHILPEVSSTALTQAAVFIPRYVLAEVVLSFFGLGVSEPTPSWGNLLANLRHYDVLESCWWMFLPAVGLVPIILAYHNIFSYYGYCLGKGIATREATTTSMASTALDR